MEMENENDIQNNIFLMAAMTTILITINDDTDNDINDNDCGRREWSWGWSWKWSLQNDDNNADNDADNDNDNDNDNGDEKGMKEKEISHAKKSYHIHRQHGHDTYYR